MFPSYGFLFISSLSHLSVAVRFITLQSAETQLFSRGLIRGIYLASQESKEQQRR